MKTRKLLLICVVAMFAMLSVVSVNMVSSKNTENDAAMLTGARVLERDEGELMSQYLTNSLQISEYYIDANEIVEVIISLDELCLLDYMYELEYSGILDFSKTEEFAAQSQVIKNEQTEMSKKLKAFGFEYSGSFDIITNAIYGNVRYGDISSIESKISGITINVSNTYELPETATSATKMQVDLVRNDIDLGYKGEGMLVGVIDSALFTSHTAFTTNPPTETLKIKNSSYVDQVANLLTARIGSATTGQTVSTSTGSRNPWVSNKIPFGFDYAGTSGTEGDVNVNPTVGSVSSYGSNHGSHVAGIAAGYDPSAGFSGIAPYAQIAFFKVFSDTSSGANSTHILMALQDAVIIGCDVVNMSLGSPSGYAGVGAYGDSASEAAIYERMQRAGLLTTNSAGNAATAAEYAAFGNYPSWENIDYGVVGSTASYPASLAVASMDTFMSKVTTHVTAAAGTAEEFDFTYNEIPGRSMLEELFMAYPDLNLLTYEFVVIPNFAGTMEDFEGIDVTGKIALMQRGGGVGFELKLQNAGAAGAIAGLVYDNVVGNWINMSIAGPTIPGAFMYLSDGEELKLLTSVNMKITFDKANYTDYGYKMSDFSAWGPLSSNSLVLKPELTSLGGTVYSSVPVVSGSALAISYANMSGTSMSAPNAAGAFALIKQHLNTYMPSEFDEGISQTEKELRAYNKTITAVRLMMSTATPSVYKYTNLEFSPRQQGAGLVQLYNAIKAQAYIKVDGQERTKIELGDDKERTGVYKLEFDVVNFGTSALTYKVDPLVMTDALGDMILGVQTLALYSYKLNPVVVVAGGNMVTVPAGETVTVTLTITLSSEDRAYLNQFPYGEYVDGFIKLIDQSVEGAINLSVPFLAFYGDWEEAPIVDPWVFSDKQYQAYNSGLIGSHGTTGSLYFVGEYIYNLDEGYEQPEFNPDRVAISGTHSTTSNYRFIWGVLYGALRNVQQQRASIIDAVTGQVYYTYEGYGSRKTFAYPNAYISGGGYISGTSTVTGLNWSGANAKEFYSAIPNNTRLYLLHEYKMEGQTEYKQSSTYYFTIDKTAPMTVSGVTFTVEGDKIMGEISVWDNQYIMAYNPLVLIGTSSYSIGGNLSTNTNMIPVYNQQYAGEVITLKFDATPYVGKITNGVIGLEITDYAMNKITWIVGIEGEIPVLNIPAQVTTENMAIGLYETVEMPLNITGVYPMYSIAEVNWSTPDYNIVNTKYINGVCYVYGKSIGTATLTGKVVYYSKGVAHEFAVVSNITVTASSLKPVQVTELFVYHAASGTLLPNSSSSGYYIRRNSTLTFRVQSNPWQSSGEFTVTRTGGTSSAAAVTIATNQANGTFTIASTNSVAGESTLMLSVAFVNSPTKVYNLFFAFSTTSGWTQGVVREYEIDSIEAPAEEAEGEIWYTTDADATPGLQITGTTVTGYTGSDPVVYLPDGITTIAANAFKDLAIEKIVFNNELTTINASAFYNCAKLKEIVWGTTGKLVTIGNSAFQLSGIEYGNLILPEGIVTIGTKAFEDCAKMIAVTIPKSCTSSNFFGSSTANSVTVKSKIYFAEGGKYISIGDYVVSKYNELLRYNGDSDYIVIPDYIVRIEQRAFVRHVPSIIIVGSNVKAIAHQAFVDAANFEIILFTSLIAPILEGGFSSTATGFNAYYQNFGNVNIVHLDAAIGYGYTWAGTADYGMQNYFNSIIKFSEISDEMFEYLIGIIDELKALGEEMQEAIDILEAKIKKFEEEKAALAALIEDLNGQIAELKKQLEEETELSQQEIDALKSEIKRLEGLLEEAGIENEELQTELNELKELVAKHEERIKELEDKVKELEAKLKAEEENAKALAAQLEAQKKLKEEALAEKAAVERELEELKNKAPEGMCTSAAVSTTDIWTGGISLLILSAAAFILLRRKKVTA